MAEKTNIWDGILHEGKYIGSNQVHSEGGTIYTLTELVEGHEYVVKLIVPSDRFKCSTFETNPAQLNNGAYGIRSLYDSGSPSAGDTFTFTANENEKFLMCYVGHASAGANSVQIGVYDMSVPDEPEEPDFEPEHSTKYLIKSEDMICTVIDDELVLLDATELTAEVFHSHGFDELPEWSVISTLTNPEILFWQGADVEEDLPTITATMTAIPYPQTIISPNYDMSDDTILGVECAYVTASSDVVFAISVDDGATWYMWTGTAWGTLTDATTGMTAETINAITTEQWAGLMTTGKFKVRATLFDENSSFTSFVMDYIN